MTVREAEREKWRTESAGVHLHFTSVMKGIKQSHHFCNFSSLIHLCLLVTLQALLICKLSKPSEPINVIMVNDIWAGFSL